MQNRPNAFQRVLSREYREDRLLGIPARDQMHHDRRMSEMAQMTGGSGFRTPSKSVRRFADGTTRGERKRQRRSAANAAIRAAHEAAWARTAYEASL
jgi:hypothetical protein